jgi:hypothetical protein
MEINHPKGVNPKRRGRILARGFREKSVKQTGVKKASLYI